MADKSSQIDDVLARESNEQIRLSFKALGGGLWDYDIDADRIQCNLRWYEIMGLDPLSKPIRAVADFRTWIHPEDVEAATSVDFDRVSRLIGEDRGYHVEFRIVRPSGDVRWLRSVACVVEDERSGHRRAVGCVTDITEFRATLSDMGGKVAAGVPARSRKPGSEGSLLTERELECLMWVSLGKTAWETANILGRSRRTIEFHLRNATRKLDAANKVHAAATAIRLGLL